MYHSPNAAPVVCTSRLLTSEQGNSQEETKQGATQLLTEITVNKPSRETKEKYTVCHEENLFLKKQNKK